MFCTGFPRPFIPPSIENNRWVRIFTSEETVGCTQAYDMWILQSELKEFYKHMINIGKGRPLVECLGLEVDNTPERIRAVNIIQKFYKKRRNKKFLLCWIHCKNDFFTKYRIRRKIQKMIGKKKKYLKE